MWKTLKRISPLLFILLIIFTCVYCYMHRDRNINVDESKSVYIKSIDGKDVLFRNGKPFKIKGADADRNSSFELLSKMGANTVRVYDTINLQSILDRALENQLAVIVDINLPKYSEKYNYYENHDKNNEIKLKVEAVVKKHKNHPALLFWNLGNEIDYPFVLRENNFIKTYNDLIDIIHKTDPNHIVSTTLLASIGQALGIHYHSPNLDLLGFNVFGNISRMNLVLDKVNLFKKPLPYFISEYGYNGPWEQQKTHWGAPIEPTSFKKAEQYVERYNAYIKNDEQSFGDLVFYWGHKQERTHTWFNIFDKEGHTSELFYELNKIWGGKLSNSKYPPKIDFMLIDERGAQESLVYKPMMEKTAKLIIEDDKNMEYQYVWEIYAEGWEYNSSETEKEPLRISKDIVVSNSSYTFKTPNKPGPYRVFVYVYDGYGNYSTTNIPFYVLN